MLRSQRREDGPERIESWQAGQGQQAPKKVHKHSQ